LSRTSRLLTRLNLKQTPIQTTPMTYLCTNCTVAIRSLPIKDSVMSFVQVIFLSFRLNINICDLGCSTVDSTLRCSRKAIPRCHYHVEIFALDFLNEPERSKYANLPNARCSIASIKLPFEVYWRRLLLKRFLEQYILSFDTSVSRFIG